MKTSSVAIEVDSNPLNDYSSGGKSPTNEVISFIAFWFGCFFICFVCPFLGCLCNSFLSFLSRVGRICGRFVGVNVEARQDNPSTSRILCPKLTKQSRILYAMKQNRMVVRENDLLQNGSDSPRSLLKTISDHCGITSDNKLIISESCAICLELYQIGEAVIWSSGCDHAFHEDCIVHWLMSKSFRSECPICRQLFVDLEHPIRGSQSQDTQINDQVVSDNIETNTNRNQGDDLV